MALSSSLVQDISLSRIEQGVKSPWGHLNDAASAPAEAVSLGLYRMGLFGADAVNRSQTVHTSRMSPELKTLFGIVIVLAIVHTVLKFRARAVAARGVTRRGRGVQVAGNPRVDGGPQSERSAAQSLAELRKAATGGEVNP